MQIRGFQGEYRWLSNFHPSPIVYANIWWPDVEHAYQAMKRRDDPIYVARLARAATAGEAKRLGKDQQGSEWPFISLGIMWELTYAKYTQNPDLKQKLLATTGYIEETNNWKDTFWGVCKGQGHNWLGKIIMNVREKLSEGK